MKKQKLAQRVIFHPISKRIASHPLTQRATHTTRKAAHLTKTTAIKIKQNPKAAAKYGIKLKLCETLILSLAFGAYNTTSFFQNPIKEVQTFYQTNPMIRNDSQKEIEEYINQLEENNDYD